MSPTIIILIVIGVFVLYIIFIFNGLVQLRNRVGEAWSDIDVQLKRRYDLIPNLINTVKGYAAHEKEIFENVAEARSKLAGAQTIPDKIAANQEMSQALGRLLMISERYPDLKANQNFLALQDELAGTENRIAVERRRYNEAVRTYNVLVRTFPSNIIARVMNYGTKEIYFEAAEGAKEVPQVNFN